MLCLKHMQASIRSLRPFLRKAIQTARNRDRTIGNSKSSLTKARSLIAKVKARPRKVMQVGLSTLTRVVFVVAL